MLHNTFKKKAVKTTRSRSDARAAMFLTGVVVSALCQAATCSNGLILQSAVPLKGQLDICPSAFVAIPTPVRPKKLTAKKAKKPSNTIFLRISEAKIFTPSSYLSFVFYQ